MFAVLSAFPLLSAACASRVNAALSRSALAVGGSDDPATVPSCDPMHALTPTASNDAASDRTHFDAARNSDGCGPLLNTHLTAIQPCWSADGRHDTLRERSRLRS